MRLVKLAPGAEARGGVVLVGRERVERRLVGHEALAAAQEDAELLVQRVLGARALQLDAAQQQRERQPVRVQHAARHALVHRLRYIIIR